MKHQFWVPRVLFSIRPGLYPESPSPLTSLALQKAACLAEEVGGNLLWAYGDKEIRPYWVQPKKEPATPQAGKSQHVQLFWQLSGQLSTDCSGHISHPWIIQYLMLKDFPFLHSNKKIMLKAKFRFPYYNHLVSASFYLRPTGIHLFRNEVVLL